MKAKYIKTIFVKDRFNPYKLNVYEYKGQQYTLKFDLMNNYLGCEIDVRGGHIYEQNLIDDRLNKQQHKSIEDSMIGFQKFWDYCNGNENAFD